MSHERILVVHGPNLNLLGTREPEVYGRTTLADIDALVEREAKALGCAVEAFQSNSEGALIDRLHAAVGQVDGVVINPGGLTHTSVSLRDAVAATGLPTVEIHISNVFAREEFRHRSMISGVAVGVISGLGSGGYALALRGLAEHLRASGGAS